MVRIANARSIAGYLAALAILAIAGVPARAEAIKTWSGATATASVFNDPYRPVSTTQTGPTASASEDKSQVVTYNGPSYSVGPWTRTVSGAATARASGEATGLLQANASYQAPNPGTRPQILHSDGVAVSASANWTGDRLSIHAADGAAMPDMIRLNFALDLAAHGGGYNLLAGSVAVTANDRTAVLYANSPALPHDDSGFFTDGTTTDFTPYTGWDQYRGLFHMDLPIGPDGLSDPFGLGLKVAPMTGLESNSSLSNSLDAGLSLLSITTPDGTLLGGLGAAVTFDSGLIAPGAQPVPAPEPSSLVVAGGLAAAYGLRRRARRSPR